MLENDGVLPLDPGRGQRIALIGPTADDPLALLCGYSFPVHLILNDAGEAAAQVVTPRAAFEQAFGAERVTYARGCYIIEERKYGSPVFPGDVEKSTTLEQASPVSRRTDLIPAAVACARAADVAVVCVGDLAGLFQTGTVGEGSDTDSLDLPGVQQQLLEAVVATGKPVVVVLMSGRPYNLGGLEDKVAAFVMAFAGGQEGGPALVDVLTGAVEPSGRLTVSVPKNVGAVPYYYNHKMKSAGTPIARHFGSRYPFGHGLGYTTFEFTDLALDAREVEAGTGEIRLHFTVRNTGTRSGVAVPQLYVRDLVASVVRPVKELKAFCRVELGAGESARVTVHMPTDMLSFTGLEGRRIVEPGQFELQVGASSADIRLRAFVEVTGAPHPRPRVADGEPLHGGALSIARSDLTESRAISRVLALLACFGAAVPGAAGPPPPSAPPAPAPATRPVAMLELRAREPEPARIAHALAVEAIMRELARRLRGDPEEWGMAGLLHDIDLAETRADPSRHGVVGARLILGLGFGAAVAQAVAAHDDVAGVPRRAPMDHALDCADRAFWAIRSSGVDLEEGAGPQVQVRSSKASREKESPTGSTGRSPMPAPLSV